jgi:2-hydroxycyclohexanecarboxyl-CoA dehydrogenase
MDLQLSDSTAVIVGGAQGIGLAIGTAFAREGARVALLDLRESVCDAASNLAIEYGVTAAGYVCDATNLAEVRATMDEIAGHFSGPKHVVYAAGCGSGKYGFPFWNMEPSDWSRVLDVNLMGAVNVGHACAPHFMESQTGTMLFISSIAGQIGSQTDPPYSAAKACVINFAQCAAKDLAEYNVRVNTLCPGMVKTEINQSVWKAWRDAQPEELKLTYEDWAGDKVKRVAPLKRWQTPEDMAELTVFLASDRAMNITGQTLNVDGGQVMHW